jgi:DNA-binding response OmpR family regulator
MMGFGIEQRTSGPITFGDPARMSIDRMSRDELVDHVRYLENEVGLSRAATEISAVSRALKINKRRTLLLLALYNAKGRILSASQLIDAMESEGELSGKTVGVAICEMRKVIGFNAIINHLALGYSISESGRKLVDDAKVGSREVARA